MLLTNILLSFSGQGKLGYITGKQSPPSKAELKGWKIDKNDFLSFKDQSLLACPKSTDNAWNVWVSTGVDKPGGQAGCLGFTALTVELDKPVKCEYTK